MKRLTTDQPELIAEIMDELYSRGFDCSKLTTEQWNMGYRYVRGLHIVETREWLCKYMPSIA